MKTVSITFNEGDFDDYFHPKTDSRDTRHDSRDTRHAAVRLIKWSYNDELCRYDQSERARFPGRKMG